MSTKNEEIQEENTITETEGVENTNDENNEPEEELSTEELKSQLEHYKRKAETWRTLSQKNEKRSKDNYKAYNTVEEELEHYKTELGKAQDELSNYRKTSVVDEVAKFYNLPPEAKALLTGTDEASLEAQAEALKSLLGTKKPVVKPVQTQGITSKPQVDMSVEEELAQYFSQK